MLPPPSLQTLRRQLSALEPRSDVPARAVHLTGAFSLAGQIAIRTDALHEVFPSAPRHAVAAHGFALSLALRATAGPIVWVLQSAGWSELGEPYGPGLAAWGLDSDDILLVHVTDAAALLAAGEDALRSGAAGAVVMSGWGEAKAYGLTASRRLALAAQTGSTLGVLVRANVEAAPSAAHTRWFVASAPSTAMAADAPGRPAFRARLTRSRAGAPPGEWTLEWDRETRAFSIQAASGGLVPVPADRPAVSRRRARAA